MHDGELSGMSQLNEECDRIVFCHHRYLIHVYTEFIFREALEGFENGITVNGEYLNNTAESFYK